MVYFALKPDAAGTTDDLVRGCRTPAAVPDIADLWAGAPADTHRPMIDRNYSVGLCIASPTRDAHDVYQTHPIHLAFIERFKATWEAVRIFDFEA